MEGVQEGALERFFSQFARSPIRWVVAAHTGLLVGVVALNRMVLGSLVTWMLDASLVIAQVALLLIWIAMDETSTIRRFLGASLLVTGIALVHLLPNGLIDPGIACLLPSIFLSMNALSLPLLLVGQAGLVIRRFHRQSLPPATQLQFSIRNVLVASFTVAFLFGLGNLPRALDATGNHPVFGLTYLVLSLAMLGIYLSIPAVAVWVVLRPGKILPRMTIALLGSGLGGTLLFHFMHQFEFPAEVQLFPAIATVGGLVIVLITLGVLRAMGYRAIWLREPAASHPDVTQGSCPFAPDGGQPPAP